MNAQPVFNARPYRIEPISLPDGYRAHAAVFAPTATKLAAGRRPVLYLHGIQSHGGWFANSASVLAQLGHTVLLPDRRGSGANGADRGHARSMRQLLDDGRLLLQRAADLGDGRPVHLLGVSWGGKWALALAGEFPDLVASLILSTPGCYSKRTLGPLGRVAVAACAAVAPRTRFAIPLNNPALFTDVEHWRRFIDDDALRLHQATARFMLISHLMQRRQRDWVARVRCPVMLALASRDPIIDNARTLDLLRRLKHRPNQLTVRHFDAAVHTLEFTADPSGYFTTLLEWMETHDA